MAFKVKFLWIWKLIWGTGGEDLLISNLKQVKTLYEGSLHEYSVCLCLCVCVCVCVCACACTRVRLRVCMSELMLLNGTARN